MIVSMTPGFHALHICQTDSITDITMLYIYIYIYIYMYVYNCCNNSRTGINIKTLELST